MYWRVLSRLKRRFFGIRQRRIKMLGRVGGKLEQKMSVVTVMKRILVELGVGGK